MYVSTKYIQGINIVDFSSSFISEFRFFKNKDRQMTHLIIRCLYEV